MEQRSGWSKRSTLFHSLKPSWQLGKTLELRKAGMIDRRIGAFVDPGDFRRDERRPGTRRERRCHVGTDRVAHHSCMVGIDTISFEDAGVRLGLFVADDLYARELVAEARCCELSLLVEQVALSHQHEPHVRR